MTQTDRVETALQALACLDLTNLEDGCTPADIETLCARAQTPHGPVAAVCIWPRFVLQAKDLLADTPVKVATVVNFPGGDKPLEEVLIETDQAMVDGADEVDVVIPYRQIRERRNDVAAQLIQVREATMGATLKAILETGELKDPELIREAASTAIIVGADFIKTSTGKVPVNATPEAAAIMLKVIAERGGKTGFKAAGGIRTLDDAAVYLDLAGEIVGPDWAAPDTFRFGASGLLDALLAEIDGRPAAAQTGY